MAEQPFSTKVQREERLTRDFALVCPGVRVVDDGKAFVLLIPSDTPDNREAHLRATAEVRFATGAIPWRIERLSSLREAHDRIAALPWNLRNEAKRRLSRSYSASTSTLLREGCQIDGPWVIWPDGERYPRPERQEP